MAMRRVVEHELVVRTQSVYNPLQTFKLPTGKNRHYQQQYADIYFVRLAQLKPIIEEAAAEAWDDYEVSLVPLLLLNNHSQFHKASRRKGKASGTSA
jgi:hypothetical protein